MDQEGRDGSTFHMSLSLCCEYINKLKWNNITISIISQIHWQLSNYFFNYHQHFIYYTSWLITMNIVRKTSHIHPMQILMVKHNGSMLCLIKYTCWYT